MLKSIKKFPVKIVVLTLVTWGLFWEIKETLTHERMIFIARWLYSDMLHAKDIEIKTYLLNDEQVLEMLSHPYDEIQQPTRRQIGTKNRNVVLRMRNLKGGVAWGRLSWTMPYGTWHVVDIPDIGVPSMKEKFTDIIIPVDTIAVIENDELPNPITVRWESLYLYR